MIGCVRKVVTGILTLARITTSYVEPSNFTIRMSMRRFTHLTNGFSSKKVEHNAGAIALHYNFAPIHKTCA